MQIPQPNQPKRSARRYGLWRLIRANLYDLGLLLNESWVVLLGFVIVTMIGTFYFYLAYCPGQGDSSCQMSLFESFYETLKLLTFNTSKDFPITWYGDLLFILIPMLGLALIFQGVLNFGRLLLDKGSRREAWQIALASTYRDHVIVCGLGRIGMRTAQELLDAGHSPVVVERDWNSEFVEHAVNSKIPVVIGDAREILTLRRAGLLRARALIAAINDDLLNVEIALTARSMRPNMRTILRVFGDELDRNLERSLGRNVAFSASALAGPTFAAAAVSREIDFVLPTRAGLLGIAHLAIQADSRIRGSVHALEAQNQFRILHHTGLHGRGHAFDTLAQLNEHEHITLIGRLDALDALQEQNQAGSNLALLPPLPTEPVDDPHNLVIVCGLGKVGYRVVRQLHALVPRPQIVVVRLNDGQPDFPQRIEQLEGVRTVIGDAREWEILRAAGIEQAISVAALTSDDLLNLEISLAARRVSPQIHIVLRVFSDTLAEKLGDLFTIRTAYSTAALASPTLAAAALVGDISIGLMIAGQLHAVEQIELGPSSGLCGQTVAQVRAMYGRLVIELLRGSSIMLLPPLETVLVAGDSIMALGPINRIERIRIPGSERPATARL